MEVSSLDKVMFPGVGLTKRDVAANMLERTLNSAIERNRMAQQLAESEEKFRVLTVSCRSSQVPRSSMGALTCSNLD